MKKNAPGAGIVDIDKGEAGKGYRFEMVKSKDGGTFVRFVALQWRADRPHETYEPGSARNAIASLQNGPATEMVDETAKA